MYKDFKITRQTYKQIMKIIHHLILWWISTVDSFPKCNARQVNKDKVFVKWYSHNTGWLFMVNIASIYTVFFIPTLHKQQLQGLIPYLALSYLPYLMVVISLTWWWWWSCCPPECSIADSCWRDMLPGTHYWISGPSRAFSSPDTCSYTIHELKTQQQV